MAEGDGGLFGAWSWLGGPETSLKEAWQARLAVAGVLNILPSEIKSRLGINIMYQQVFTGD